MPEPQKSTKSRVPQSVIDVIIAVALVASIFVAMFAYTGNWPPLVVIESRSMQHSESESFLGIMDTGDLVLVKSIDSRNDVVTYYQGLARNYKSYGDYGDVIIYLKGGSTQYTPIIHRAVIYLSANPGDDSFRAEELRNLTEGSDYYFVDG
ncbi:MAG: S26 family signal peptidase, partial [Thermoplasmata archaeon]|nr:S26 family signal peptidase [Thermoplasmata archaeon]